MFQKISLENSSAIAIKSFCQALKIAYKSFNILPKVLRPLVMLSESQFEDMEELLDIYIASRQEASLMPRSFKCEALQLHYNELLCRVTIINADRQQIAVKDNELKLIDTCDNCLVQDYSFKLHYNGKGNTYCKCCLNNYDLPI